MRKAKASRTPRRLVRAILSRAKETQADCRDHIEAIPNNRVFRTVKPYAGGIEL